MSKEALAAVSGAVETAPIHAIQATVAQAALPRATTAKTIPLRVDATANSKDSTTVDQGDAPTAEVVSLLNTGRDGLSATQPSPIVTSEAAALINPEAANSKKPNHRYSKRGTNGRFAGKPQPIMALPPSPSVSIETALATTTSVSALTLAIGAEKPAHQSVSKHNHQEQSEATLFALAPSGPDTGPTTDSAKARRRGTGKTTPLHRIELVQQTLPIDEPKSASTIEAAVEQPAIEAATTRELNVVAESPAVAVVRAAEPKAAAVIASEAAPSSGEVIDFPQNDMAAAKENFEAYRGRLREFYGTDIYTAWFQSLKLESMVGSKLALSVPTRFLKSWIQSHYIDGLLKIWQEIHPNVSVVEIGVRSPIARPATQHDIEVKARSTASSVSQFTRPASATPDRAVGRSSLDARLTFANFVCGESNRLALNAAKLAASVDAANTSSFNPLYIHGGVGLGKTHLLQSIAADNPGRALYISAESFMYNIVDSAQNRSFDLKNILANVDILLMDDLQFLQSKSTITELALIVSAMIDAGRQVIFAADRSPGQLDCQDDRLASRLKKGYCVEIGNPEPETRLGILDSHLKSDYPSMVVPEDVLQHLSDSIVTTGRDLVGALNKMYTASRLANQTNQPITMDMADAAVRQINEAQPVRRVKIEDIQKATARYFKISKDDMISARRTSNLHAVRKIEQLMSTDEEMENNVSTLRRLISCTA
jgi:chromosomal replication initiator protein